MPRSEGWIPSHRIEMTGSSLSNSLQLDHVSSGSTRIETKWSCSQSGQRHSPAGASQYYCVASCRCRV